MLVVLFLCLSSVPSHHTLPLHRLPLSLQLLISQFLFFPLLGGGSPLWHNRWQGFPCSRLSNNTTLYSHMSHIINHPMVSVSGAGEDGLHLIYNIQVPNIALENVRLPYRRLWKKMFIIKISFTPQIVLKMPLTAIFS